MWVMPNRTGSRCDWVKVKCPGGAKTTVNNGASSSVDADCLEPRRVPHLAQGSRRWPGVRPIGSDGGCLRPSLFPDAPMANHVQTEGTSEIAVSLAF
jgi:hypothetical protein